MGKKNLNHSLDSDYALFGDEFDVQLFEQDHYEKDSRRNNRRKLHRRAELRKRFSDEQEARWLKRQVRDWEHYDTHYDTDEEDFHRYTFD